MTGKLTDYLTQRPLRAPPFQSEKKRQRVRGRSRGVKAGSLSPLAPTPERQGKVDYEGSGKRRRRADTLAELERKGHISSEHKNAAERWAADWVLAHEGYADFLHQMPSARALANTLAFGKGDRLTMEMGKSHAWARISAVRAALGVCAHLRLQAMLIGDPRTEGDTYAPMSFPAMGVWLYPALSRETARKKVSVQCAFLLEQLSEYYRTHRRG